MHRLIELGSRLRAWSLRIAGAAVRTRARIALVVLVAGGGLALLVTTLDRVRLAPSPPQVQSDERLVITAPPSRFDVPIRIRSGRLLPLVERNVPLEWSGETGGTDEDRRDATLTVRRGPFAASFEDGRASLSTTFTYEVRTSYALPLLPDIGLSCGTGDGPPPRMDVQITSPLSLSADWRLLATTEVASVAPTTELERDRCEVTFLDFDITGSVVEGIRTHLQERTAALDSVIGSIDLRPSFERWWQVLASPVEIGSEIWLDMRPDRIAYDRVTGDSASITVHAQLTAQPRIHFGRKPPTRSVALPELSRTESGGRNFVSVVSALADYEEIAAVLTESFSGRSFRALGRRVTVERIGIRGLGANRVGVEVGVSGDVSGTLYFVGSPTYRAADSTVRLPDLSMTVETSDVVVEGASWLLESGLESMLESRARWPVEEGVEWAASELERGLNSEIGDGVRLRGRLDGLRVQSVAARTTGLLVVAQVSGEVDLIIDTRN